MASASGREGQPVHGGKVTSWLWRVFELNPAGLNWPRAVLFLDVALVPLVVFWAIGHEEYLLSALFGALFAWLADPGGGYGQRASRIAVFALFGAGLTALGFGIGGDAWGWLVLAAFAVTLAGGLAVTFGVRRFVVALVLNLWFIITLAVASGFHHAHITSYTWAQVLAWAGGSALWIAVTFIEWLVRGREDRPQPIAELPGDTSPRKLTRPVIMFAVIRALVIAGTVALAFGLNLSHGYWMPIAAMSAMQPSLEQSALIAGQRLAGTLIGAVAAALLLLIPASEHGLRLFAVDRGLEVVALVLLMHGVAIRFWNYALYTGAIAAGVLTLIDLPQPSNQLMPDEPEAHGLLALMMIHHARRRARFSGEDLVLLDDQDRSLWDHAQIAAGRAVLDRAAALGGRGAQVIQAAIALLQTAERFPAYAEMVENLKGWYAEPPVVEQMTVTGSYGLF